jgi:sugar phosphate permease
VAPYLNANKTLIKLALLMDIIGWLIFTPRQLKRHHLLGCAHQEAAAQEARDPRLAHLIKGTQHSARGF